MVSAINADDRLVSTVIRRSNVRAHARGFSGPS